MERDAAGPSRAAWLPGGGCSNRGWLTAGAEGAASCTAWTDAGLTGFVGIQRGAWPTPRVAGSAAHLLPKNGDRHQHRSWDGGRPALCRLQPLHGHCYPDNKLGCPFVARFKAAGLCSISKQRTSE